MTTIPTISATQFGATQFGATTHARRPLLVLGPSLGTSAASLWSASGESLAADFHIIAWDLPGHGASAPATDGFSMAELATGVLTLVETVLIERGEPGGTFSYAGDSVGAAVGLQLLLDHPGRINSATLLCTSARFGTPGGWSERAESVRLSGTQIMVRGSAARWFAPGFPNSRPDLAAALLQALRDTNRFSYAWVCDALAGFDVRVRLGEITAPVLAIAGDQDSATPVAYLREIADGVTNGELKVLAGVAHLAPAEAPAEVARLIADHLSPARTVADIRGAGLVVRRAVLGDAHVDRATANATDFTREFHEFITQYAWGSIWTRPGLDRRSRSLITLTALVARGHHDELALHIRAARTNGLTNDEIKELLLQTAIYCGVPDANSAFRIAQGVLAEIDATDAAEQP